MKQRPLGLPRVLAGWGHWARPGWVTGLGGGAQGSGGCRWPWFVIHGWGVLGQNNPSACPHLSPSLQCSQGFPDNCHHGDSTSGLAP